MFATYYLVQLIHLSSFLGNIRWHGKWEYNITKGDQWAFGWRKGKVCQAVNDVINKQTNKIPLIILVVKETMKKRG